MAEVAALCSNCPIDEMVAQIPEVLPNAKVMAIRQVVKGRMETLGHFHTFAYGLSGLVMLVGGLVVLVTIMGSVQERTSKFGIFRAIGFRKRHLVRLVLFEAGIISTDGCFSGKGVSRSATGPKPRIERIGSATKCSTIVKPGKTTSYLTKHV